MTPTVLRKTLLSLLSLVICGGLVLSTPGCSVLFPTPSNDHKVPDDDKKPDDDKPAPLPADPFNARPGMAKALAADKVPHSQAILLYGVFTGTADYVSGLNNDTDLTTTSLGETKMAPLLDRVGWPHGKYLEVKKEIARIWTAAGFEEQAQPLSDSVQKQKLIDMYRNMANGCKDAVGSTK